MKIIKAGIAEAEIVRRITHETIQAVYTHYYPKGAVQFFDGHHSIEHIRESIEKGHVFLIEAEGDFVGTVTIDEQEINRLFILPEHRGKGYGKALMQFAEAQIFSCYEKAMLSASLPAKGLYIKNGYKEVGTYQIQTEDGDILCYDYMEKQKPDQSQKDNTSPMQAKDYDKGILKTLPFYTDFNKQIIELVSCLQEEKKDVKIEWLDTGCGTGTLAVLVAKQLSSIHFTLMDPSEKMMEECRAKTSHLGADYEVLPSQEIEEEGKFDVITAVQAHHYFQPLERKEATERIFKALKKEGIYITFENYAPYHEELVSFELRRWGNYQRAHGKSEEEVKAHLARYNKQYFPITIKAHLALLRDAGFKKIHVFWKSYMQVGIYAVK